MAASLRSRCFSGADGAAKGVLDHAVIRRVVAGHRRRHGEAGVLEDPAGVVDVLVGLTLLNQFRSVDSDPMLMGRSAGVYDALRIYPSTIVEVMESLDASSAGTTGS